MKHASHAHGSLAHDEQAKHRFSSHWLRAGWRSCLLALLLVSGTFLFMHQAPIAHAQSSTISIDANTTYQTIDGFGTSLVDQTGAQTGGPLPLDLYQMNATQQQQILDLLFNSSTGAGLSIDRFELGAGYFYGVPDFTVEPNNPGSPTATPSYVWDHSADHQVWIAQQAQQRGVSQFYADAWSAPAFMKNNDSVSGLGSLCGEVSCSSGDWRQAYANYLVQYLKDYQSEGINVSHVAFDNEPGSGSSYQSMSWTSAQLTDFVNVLGPTFASAHLSTSVACCDEAGYSNSSTALNTVLADPTAASYLGVASVHGYGTGGVVSPFTSATNAGKHTWETEYSCIGDSWNTLYSSGNCDGRYWSDNIYQTLINGVNAYFSWTGAWGHTDNEDLIQLTSSTSYQVSSRLWVMGNYSRYVRPGATRIGASSGDGNMLVTAFKNTDGSYALVVDNHESSPIPTTISIPALSSGTATPYVTDDAEGMAQQTPITVSNGAFSVVMPPNATITFKMTSANGSLANGTYVIEDNNNTGEYLSIQNSDPSDGALVNQWAWIIAPVQYWIVTSVGNGLYTIQNRSTGKYLSIYNNVTTEGAEADQWHWVSASTQYWSISSTGNGMYRIQENSNTGEYLSIQNNATTEGALADQWQWVPESTQYWTFFPVLQ